MNIEESLKKLFSLHQFGIKLGLEKPKQLFQFIGNPEKNLKCFHVAGSNAKGSVSSFISSILIEEGYKVGLYTSPHFVKFNERIRINGAPIPDSFIMNFMNNLEVYIEESEPTFFELTTAMAFQYFDESNVDYAVIETGLGGRLDATNVIDPVASVITTISLEHTNILGNSIEEIAYEKGEIIKSNCKAFCGLLSPAAKSVISEKADRVKANIYHLNDYMESIEDHLCLHINDRTITLYQTPLIGSYQLRNAALSVLTVISSLKIKSMSSIFAGINNVVKNSGIQGRFEIYHESPTVIFDSSHNEEGIANFISEFRSFREKYESVDLVFGVMKDKNIAKMLNKFNSVFDTIYAATFDYERAASVEMISKIASDQCVDVISLDDPASHILNFMKSNEKKCLVVLGSIYLLGKIKSDLLMKNA